MPVPIRAAAEASRALRRMARPTGSFDASRYFRGQGDLGFYNVGTPAIRALARSIYASNRDQWSVDAAMAFAEWLAITYGDAGIKVSALCPQGVRTRMLGEFDHRAIEFLRETALDPEDVAEAVVQGLADERFLILPHPEVAEYFRRKGDDYDRWLRGMRRLQAKIAEGAN